MIYAEILAPGTLSATSPGIAKLLPLILSSQTSLPLIMDAKWANFFGRDTLVCDAYTIKSTKQFVNTLVDNIRKREAMHTLISDGSSYKISKKVTDMLRSLFIADY